MKPQPTYQLTLTLAELITLQSIFAGDPLDTSDRSLKEFFTEDETLQDLATKIDSLYHSSHPEWARP